MRGLVVLYETLIIGSRWLVRSAGLQVQEEGVELGKGGIAVMLALTAVVAIGVFFLLPLFVASAATGGQGDFTQHIVEGVVRVALFIGYLLVISRAGDMKRVFMYHGAEHMTIHALEHDDPLTVEKCANTPRHTSAAAPNSS